MFAFAVLFSVSVHAQIRFSVAPDISLMRNFSPQQKFWALGETIQLNFHFDPKQTAYAWITYYTAGNFHNPFIATAKSSTTIPSAIPFTAYAVWRNNEISLGWKHFFKGSFDAANGYNIYSTMGFGLMFTKVQNTFTPAVDTSVYNTPTNYGNSNFYRLTFDIGAGAEFPLGANFFLYSDVRTWIPTTSYPSPFLQNNKNVPMPFMIAAGMRVLFGY